MRLALVALLLALPAASSAEAPAPARSGKAALAPMCGHDLKVRPVRPGQGVRAKRLGELPSGDLTLTVLDQVGGCIEPRVVRQGFGALGDGNGR